MGKHVHFVPVPALAGRNERIPARRPGPVARIATEGELRLLLAPLQRAIVDDQACVSARHLQRNHVVELTFGRILFIRCEDFLRVGDVVQIIRKTDADGPKLVPGARLPPDDPLVQIRVESVRHHIVGVDGVAHPVTGSALPGESVFGPIDIESARSRYVGGVLLFQLVSISIKPVLGAFALRRSEAGHTHGQKPVRVEAIGIAKYAAERPVSAIGRKPDQVVLLRSLPGNHAQRRFLPRETIPGDCVGRTTVPTDHRVSSAVCRVMTVVPEFEELFLVVVHQSAVAPDELSLPGMIRNDDLARMLLRCTRRAAHPVHFPHVQIIDQKIRRRRVKPGLHMILAPRAGLVLLAIHLQSSSRYKRPWRGDYRPQFWRIAVRSLVGHVGFHRIGRG